MKQLIKKFIVEGKFFESLRRGVCLCGNFDTVLSPIKQQNKFGVAMHHQKPGAPAMKK